ncbi:hypothetical protein BP6252_00711 [Coleophoma cylindrospora]|uniref:Single-strand DNA deaminase toxin A-like C-terminal domain-containing protein n=1 Tax=Coleophoma cylindrospora TaxID=1849047 RepID=A0A3D8SQU6_9HELO|nr:hypothetical protein BP6252_00711 [Coleophoma cylindrospora]
MEALPRKYKKTRKSAGLSHMTPTRSTYASWEEVSIRDAEEPQAEEDFDIIEFEEVQGYVTPKESRERKKKKKSKKAAKKIPRTNIRESQVMVSISDSEDELGDRGQLPPITVNPKAAVKSLRAILEYLEQIGEADEIRMWMQDHEFLNRGEIFELRSIFAKLDRLLVAPGSATTEAVDANEVRINWLGNWGVEILKPVEVVRATKNLKQKTLGLLRVRGEPLIIKAALSGWEDCTKPHSIMVNSFQLTKTAMAFAKKWGFKFESFPWMERRHKVLPGCYQACHVEVQLMMWFCGHLMVAQLGLDNTKVELYRELIELRPHPEAEILLSADACKECMSFRDKVGEIVGIHFEFVTQPSVGMLQPEPEEDLIEDLSSVPMAITKTTHQSKNKENPRKHGRGYLEPEPEDEFSGDNDFEWTPSKAHKSHSTQSPRTPNEYASPKSSAKSTPSKAARKTEMAVVIRSKFVRAENKRDERASVAAETARERFNIERFRHRSF